MQLLVTCRMAIERFGILAFKDDIKALLPQVVKLANHKASAVKEAAVQLMTAVTVRLGKQPRQ